MVISPSVFSSLENPVVERYSKLGKYHFCLNIITVLPANRLLDGKQSICRMLFCLSVLSITNRMFASFWFSQNVNFQPTDREAS